MERIVLAMMCGLSHTDMFVVNKTAFRLKSFLSTLFEYARSV